MHTAKWGSSNPVGRGALLLLLAALSGCSGDAEPAPAEASATAPSASPSGAVAEASARPLRLTAQLALEGVSPTALAVADLLGDARPELVVAFSWGAPELFRLESGGGWVRGAAPEGRKALASGDLDGDGHADLVSSITPPGVLISLGARDGFVPGLRETLPGAAAPPEHLVLLDVDGDGALDLLVSLPGDEGGLIHLRGHGDGGFELVKRHALDAGALALGDLDGDGRLDVVVADGGGVSSFLATADGLHHASYAGHAQVTGAPIALDLGDINGDGLLDVVACSRGSRSLKVWRGRGDGSFAAGAPLEGYVALAVCLVDLTGDGALDLVLANEEADALRVLQGAGNGEFTPVRDLPCPGVTRVLARDLDGDGRSELIAAGSELRIWR